ncbi:MAG: hypothetical protein GY847_09980 [Proteobacteria bacterium]|nr:hypothetical protein [Pseudomonadota bacterium]
MRDTLEELQTKCGTGAILSGAVGEFVYLKAILDARFEHNFYTGFSGDIDSGGVFISTYDVKPIDTPVAVSILFPNRYKISARGVVQWIREYNPLIPEMTPGMGVKLTSLDAYSRMRIQNYLKKHTAIFYDDDNRQKTPSLGEAPIEPTNKKAHNYSKDEDQEWSIPAPELSHEHTFLKGLTRDVDAYLKNKPSFKETLVVKVVTGVCTERQFQGGFTQKDGKSRIFIVTSEPLRINTRVRVLIKSPDGWQLSAEGVVRWVRRHNPLVSSAMAPPGMGIHLDDLSSIAWQTLAQYIPQGEGYLLCEK